MSDRVKQQNFGNHTRYFALFHFLASPVTGLYALHSIAIAVGRPSQAHWFEALYALAIFGGVMASRIMAITVQNRVIRLEMRLRLREVLPAALQPRIRELGVRQLAALRFASDAELPRLVERVLAGEFPNTKEIKRAIVDWQADYLRV
ncbi:MAG: DUF6526 family protein [Gemmatimonadaceae bacterium]